MSLTKPRAHQLLDLDFKQSCRVVTTSNITSLSTGAPLTVDGINLDRGDRVLVTAQNTASQNGVYRVSSVGTGSNGVWVRAADFDSSTEVTAGIMITVVQGTGYADSIWKLTTDDPITIGSTSLSWSQVSTGTGSNSFGIIDINGVDIEADQVGDQLIINTGNNIVATANVTTDTVTLAVSDSPSFSGYVSVTGGDGGNSSLVLDGYNQRGGVGYHGFLEVTNTYGSATNPSKHFRIAADGSLEIVNSGYSANLFTLSDAGQLYLSQVIASSSTTTGTLRVGGGAGIGGNIHIGGNLVAGNITSTPILGGTGGSINNIPIGNATASTGAFTTLTASGTVTLSPVSADVTLSPSVTGKVVIGPNTTGAINNMIIGNSTAAAGTFTTLTSTSTTSLGATSATAINSTPIGNSTASTGAFTTLTASGTVTLSPTSADVNISPTVLGKVTMAPNTTGSINNMIIGNATAAAGTFTSLSSSSTTTLGLTSATALNSTPVGNSSASTGAFTTLTSNGATTFTAGTVSTSTGSGTVVVTGGLGASGNVWGGGFFTGNVSAFASGTGSTSAGTTQTLRVAAGGLAVTGNTYFANDVGVAGGTASTTTTTGSMVVTGGAGVSGNINAGGNVKAGNVIATGTLYYNSTTPVTRSLSVGTRTSPITVALAAGGTFNLVTRNSGNVAVSTSA